MQSKLEKTLKQNPYPLKFKGKNIKAIYEELDNSSSLKKEYEKRYKIDKLLSIIAISCLPIEIGLMAGSVAIPIVNCMNNITPKDDSYMYMGMAGVALTIISTIPGIVYSQLNKSLS